MKSPMKVLMEQFPYSGRVDWIGIRTARRSPIQVVEHASISEFDGLVGDHYKGRSKKRQVTLIQAEHIEAVKQLLKKQSLEPEIFRRNIVVSGINLLALRDEYIQIGKAAILLITGACHPCSRMEEYLGHGGYNAMRGHGGVTAKVIQGGEIKKGDKVLRIEIPNELKSENQKK